VMNILEVNNDLVLDLVGGILFIKVV